MSRSYPFLALALRHGVNYGLVLTYADVVRHRMPDRKTLPNTPQRETAMLWFQGTSAGTEIYEEVRTQMRVSCGELEPDGRTKRGGQ